MTVTLARAQTYAKAVGAELGRVLSIREGQITSLGTGTVETVVVTAERKSAPSPIAAGEQSVSAEVTEFWELK